MLNSLEHEISTALRLKYQQIKNCLGLSPSDVVFIMLVNVKMPTLVCWHFNIYEQDKFRAQLSLV